MKLINPILCIIVSMTPIYALDKPKTVSAEKSIGKINFLIGRPSDVRLKHRNAENWQNVKLNMEVKNGDVITTAAESRCEVKLNEGSIVRIGEKSTFEFTQTNLSQDSKKVNSKLSQGRVWTNIQKFKGKKDEFTILAPTAVCAVRGTIYRLDADSTTRIAVYDGEVDVGPAAFWGQPQQPKSKSLEPVEVPGPYEIPGPYEVSLEEWIRIVRGFQIEIRTDGKYAKSRIDLRQDARDEWIRWNQVRDRLIGR